MPSVASFMMPAGKAVTACPEDKLRSVVDSLVNEKIGCVVVVDAGKAVGIITKQDVNRFFLSEVRTQPPRPRLPSLSSLNPTPWCSIRSAIGPAGEASGTRSFGSW